VLAGGEGGSDGTVDWNAELRALRRVASQVVLHVTEIDFNRVQHFQ